RNESYKTLVSGFASSLLLHSTSTLLAAATPLKPLTPSEQMASNIILFEDIFVVLKLDPDGKKFDKGSYFFLKSTVRFGFIM
ncbi:hypothetical protein IGI04_014259, partial [Brassica rapa subsp. trilocularis]